MNLETSLRTSIAAEVTESGATTASEARLSDWIELQDSKAEVAMKADEKSLAVAVGRNRAKLGVASAEDYPPLPVLDAAAITLSAEQLARGIALALPSVAKQDIGRAALGSLMLQFAGSTLTLVGADGHRLGIGNIELDTGLTEPVSLLVPRTSAVTLAGLLSGGGDITIATNERNTLAAFVTGATTLTTRLIGETFPDYRRMMIPTEYTAICIVPSSALGRQIQAALLVDDASRVHLEFGPDGVSVRARAAGIFEEHEGRIDGEVTGDAAICLNGAFMLDAIKALASDRVHLGVTGPSSPVVITDPDEPGIGLQVLMQMFAPAQSQREVAA